MFTSRRERGFSILEVLFSLVILALIMVPIIQIFSSSHRMGFSARRLVDVTIHVQSIVEAVSELDPADFPQVNGEKVLMDDEAPPVGGGTAKYQEICDYFARKKPVDGMKRFIIATRLPTGEVELRIEVTWNAIQGEDRTQQKLVLPMLATPRNWQ